MFRIGRNLFAFSQIRCRAVSACCTTKIQKPTPEDYRTNYSVLLDFYKDGGPSNWKFYIKQLSNCQVDKDYLMELNIQNRTELRASKENELFLRWRLIIDDYEESFPQPYDEDFEEKKIIWKKETLNVKVGLDLHEERRRQKWAHYLENPPNDRISKLATRLKTEKVSYELFSEGIAKAYRLLSDKFPSGFVKVAYEVPKKNFVYKRIVIAMRILLKEEDILDELIDIVAPKIDPDTK